jgi:UDP-N-acetylmuramoyl-tripeptide--D-alanyl-D-alanine ligase
MLELGEGSRALHIALADAIEEANVDLVFACGPDMFALFHALPVRQRGLWAAESKGISATVADLLRPGDAVMVKGSLGSRMAPVVAEITNRFGGTVV